MAKTKNKSKKTSQGVASSPTLPEEKIDPKTQLLWDSPTSPLEEKISLLIEWDCPIHQYKIRRMLGHHEDTRSGFVTLFYNKSGKYWDCLINEVKGSSHPKFFKTLEAALLGVKEYHLKKHSLSEVISNEKEVLEQAKVNKIHTVGRIEEEPITNPITGEKVTVTKTKGTKKNNSSGAGKDFLGCKLGSQAAEINNILTKKGKTAKQISEEVNLKENRVKGHLNWWVKRGKLVKEGDMYSLPT